MNDSNPMSALNQLIMPKTVTESPIKVPPVDDMMQQILQGLPIFTANGQFQAPVDSEKPSSSEESGSPRQGSPDDYEQVDAAVPIKDYLKPVKNEGWYECFNTTSKAEFDALIYSMYVIDKDDRKLDGWQYYECFNRLQNKCRYKVRSKKQDEFYIIEEKSGHNHGIEPVGQAGSHAGLPKALREIVDKAYYEDWPSNVRQARIEEEVRRLGLPKNPRLNRQMDNRVAYLRRVKNLNESKKMQDQVQLIGGGGGHENMFPPHMLQMMMDQGLLGPSVGQVINEQMKQEANEKKQSCNETSAIQALLEAQREQAPPAEIKKQLDQPKLEQAPESIQEPPQIELQTVIQPPMQSADLNPPELVAQIPQAPFQPQPFNQMQQPQPEAAQEPPRHMDPLMQLQQLAMQNGLTSEKLAEMGFQFQ